LARVFVTDTTEDAPTVFVNIRYLAPADTVFAVVIVLDVLAVPVRFAKTVVHVNVPPVFVRASVFGLYVKAVACVRRDAVDVPVAVFVNRRRNAVAEIVLFIVIVDPAPEAPCGIVMSKIAAEEVPTLVTVAEVPGPPVVTVPTAIVAAVPVLPAGPWIPWIP
jgi:hypothetical protein